jgi:hypothetical protein
METIVSPCRYAVSSRSIAAHARIRLVWQLNSLNRIRVLRIALLLSVALGLVMIPGRVALDPQLLGLPGGLQTTIAAAVTLVVAALVVFCATSARGEANQEVIWDAAVFGVLSGVLEAIHITVENFGNLAAAAERISTGLFMLGLFLIWGVAGYRATRRISALEAGACGGAWAAIVGMLFTVTYGFSQLFWALPRLEQRSMLSPDFLRSGWTDLHSFTIIDVFEAGVKVLIIGPIVGAIVGGLGGVIALAVGWIRRRGD